MVFFLSGLIELGRIEELWIGVKNERKVLKNRKLVEFLESFEFENNRSKLEKESVTLFPLFLVGIIGIVLVLAFRSGYEHALLLLAMMVIYFFRSMLFKEIKGL